MEIIIDKISAETDPTGTMLSSIDNQTDSVPLMVGEALTGDLHATAKVDHIHVWGGEAGSPPGLYLQESTSNVSIVSK